MKSVTNRIFKDRLLKTGIIVLSGLSCVPLLLILGEMLLKGWKQLSWSFLTQSTPTSLEAMLAVNSGERIPGGIANGIVGTLIMVLIATAIAVPIGLLCGIYLSEHRKTRFATTVRFLTELLQGTPSIIIGIIAYLWMVVPMKTHSALAGAIALSIMMLPLIVRSTEETLYLLPASLKEAALALGSSYRSMVIKVLLPALGASMIQWDPTRPSSAVSLLIWQFYNDPNLNSMIWSASLFLLLFVLLLNITAKQISKKWRI